MQNLIKILFFGLLLSACNPLPNPGKDLYVEKCQNCHGVDGEGLKGLYPNLVNADYFQKNREKLACIIKYGVNEEMEVNGTKYQGEMPANAMLTEIEITNLLNFINQEFKNGQEPFSMQEISKNLVNCK